ncbi:hypothetical protein ZWY2020_005950 [Hordeum vulgare]|nr:hypothetical protein ZWY2020_005950 [Hordeum vulgare]
MEAAAVAAAEQVPPPPPARLASAAAASLVFEAMEGDRGEGAGGPADLSHDMAACERRIVQVVLGRKGIEVLTNEAGEVTSHLQGMLKRTVRLLEAGITHSIAVLLICLSIEIHNTLNLADDKLSHLEHVS